ncbi:prepilin-type N-terminal cleavage/methylation domain-containing protein [Pleurocapsales cyanobacterium LEGE 06147]|nr:prepilin-type N-terminal cleavage/methylation domain-containing protein [Pleurocapsales cyanobacterium LEGE 06147]
MKPYNLFKFFSKQKTYTGFTLTELLIGAAITSIVVGAAGFGLVQIMRTSQKGNTQAERRSEVARAYDFISDEIRRSRLVLGNNRLTDPDTSDDDDEYLDQQVTVLNKPFNADGKEVVLFLKVPVTDANIDKDGNNNNEATIVYYVGNPPNNSVWKGPKVLYRWGPPIGNNGEYTDGNWQENPLIDRVAANTITPDCQSGWASSSAAGFAACIDPNNKTAQLFINGNIVTPSGSDNSIYSADTKTVARADIDRNINFNDPVRRTYALGGDFACNRTNGVNTPWAIDTEVTLYNQDSSVAVPKQTLQEGGSSELNIAANQKVTITSKPQDRNDCNPLTSKDPITVDIQINNDGTYTHSVTAGSSNKVLIFRNDDIVPDEVAYDGQKTLKAFLEKKGFEFEEVEITDGDTPITKYKIVMNPNQLLIAFEIGQDNPTLSNGELNPGFDHQDNLVLITSDALLKDISNNL